MQERSGNTHTDNNQLKATILGVWDFLKELLKKSYWFVIAWALVGAFVFWQHGKKSTTYTAHASLMSAGDEGGGGGLLQLAGQLGLGGKKEVSSEKLVELLTTKRIIYNTLLNNVVIDGKNDLIFNHFLNIFKNDKYIESKEDVKGFRFTAKPLEEFDYKENILAESIYNDIKMQCLNANASNNGIVRVYVTSTSEQFAKEFTQNLVETLKDFYVSKTVEKQETALQIITERTDSIKKELESAESALMAWYDSKQKRLAASSLSAQAYLSKIEYERRAEIASAAYVEALKNKELAQMNLETQTPVIQMIDLPAYPLKENPKPFLKPLLIALILVSILLATLIILNKVIKDALND